MDCEDKTVVLERPKDLCFFIRGICRTACGCVSRPKGLLLRLWRKNWRIVIHWIFFSTGHVRIDCMGEEIFRFWISLSCCYPRRSFLSCSQFLLSSKDERISKKNIILYKFIYWNNAKTNLFQLTIGSKKYTSKYHKCLCTLSIHWKWEIITLNCNQCTVSATIIQTPRVFPCKQVMQNWVSYFG